MLRLRSPKVNSSRSVFTRNKYSGGWENINESVILSRLFVLYASGAGVQQNMSRVIAYQKGWTGHPFDKCANFSTASQRDAVIFHVRQQVSQGSVSIALAVSSRAQLFQLVHLSTRGGQFVDCQRHNLPNHAAILRPDGACRRCLTQNGKGQQPGTTGTLGGIVGDGSWND